MEGLTIGVAEPGQVDPSRVARHADQQGRAPHPRSRRATADLAVAALGLGKRFGPVHALERLDLLVHPGEVHGLIGPNGSGKSTAVRMVLGLLTVDRGRARVLGLDPWRQRDELHSRLAYVPDDVELWPRLTGSAALDLLGRLRGSLDLGRRELLAERFGVDLARTCGACSRGTRQKIALVGAFASDAELIVLDNPTTALDLASTAVFADCVRQARERGRTVLLSSHVLPEVDALCDRVTVLRAGQDVRRGSVPELRRAGIFLVDATVVSDPAGLVRLPVEGLRIEGHRLRCRVGADQLGGLLEQLAHLGLVTLRCEPPTLLQSVQGCFSR